MKDKQHHFSQESALIQVSHLKKYYPVKGGIVDHTVGQVRAVDDISLEIQPAQTLGLVGESGCGKSTVGRLLVGLEEADEGNILYKGQELVGMKEKDRRKIRTELQMVFQDPFSSLNPRKRIYEILAQPMLYHHLAHRGTVEQEVGKLLDLVGLPKNAAERYPHEFSGGQRQRIAIARALSLKPEFLVCDEPVSALDVSIQAQILNLLKELQKELGLTMLFIGHGLGSVHYVSDRIAVMYLGKIVETGKAQEVFGHPAHPYTKALVEAVPLPDPVKMRQKKTLLSGEVNSMELERGCRFAARCPYASEVCKEQEPQMQCVSQENGHFAACVQIGR